MANPTLTARMKNYFERQVDLYRAMLADYDELFAHFDEERMDEMAERQHVNAREAASLDREFQLLLREWRAAEDLDASEREEVRRLARQAEEVNREVTRRTAEAAEQVERHMKTVKQDSRKLRRGLEALRKFRPVEMPEPGLIDKRT